MDEIAFPTGRLRHKVKLHSQELIPWRPLTRGAGMRAAVLLLCVALPTLSRLASAGENRRLAFAAPAVLPVTLPAASPSDAAHAGGRRAPGALRCQMTATLPEIASPATGTEDDIPVLRLIALKEGASVQNARRDRGGGASSMGRRPDASILRCLATPAHVFCRRPLHTRLLAARTRHAAHARSRALSRSHIV